MIYAVVLSAGASTRIGSAKALLRLADGKTFLQTICEQARAAGVARVLVVTAAPHGEEIRKSLPTNTQSAINPHPERGMLSSVQVAVRELPHDARGMLVWPVDTPLVARETVQTILGAASEKIVVPEFAGRGGHPIYVPKNRFTELLALDHTQSLKSLMIDRAQVARIAVDDKNILLDVDTLTDLTVLLKS